MKPETVKKALNDTIQAVTDSKFPFSVRPGKHNTRNRKFPFQKRINFQVYGGAFFIRSVKLIFLGCKQLNYDNAHKPKNLQRKASPNLRKCAII